MKRQVDPNENLTEQRVLAAELVVRGDVLRRSEILARATRLAELSAELDEWIVGGGFLPAAWQP